MSDDGSGIVKIPNSQSTASPSRPVQQKYDQGSASVETSQNSLHAYGNYPATWFLNFDETAIDTNNNTTVFESGDISIYNQIDFHIVSSPTTGILISVSHDGVNYEAQGRYAINNANNVIATNVTLGTSINGTFRIEKLKAKKIRIRQLGAGAAMRIRGSLSNA